MPIGPASLEAMANRKRFRAGLIARGMRVHAPNPVRYTDAIIAAVLKQWAAKPELAPEPKPEPAPEPKPSTALIEMDIISEEEARSSEFAKLMAKARALKPGDDAGVQDLLYKAAGKAARDKITPLQAQMLVEAIKKSTGFKMEGLSKTFQKVFQDSAKRSARRGGGSCSLRSGRRSGRGPRPVFRLHLLLRCGRLHPG